MSQQQSYQLATYSTDQSNQKLQEAPNNQLNNQENSNQYIQKIIQSCKETTRSLSQTPTPSSFGNSLFTNANNNNNISQLKTEQGTQKNQLENISDQASTNQEQKNNFSNLPPIIPKVSKPGEPSSFAMLGQNSQISIENTNNLKNSVAKLNQNLQNITGVEPYEPYRKNYHQRQSSMFHLNNSSSSTQLQSLVAQGSETKINNQVNSNSQQQQVGMKLSQTLGENKIKQIVANKIDEIKKQQDIDSAANIQFKKEFINQFVASQSGHLNSTDIFNRQNRVSFQSDLTPIIPYESYYNKQQMRNSRKFEIARECFEQPNKDTGNSIINNHDQQNNDQKEKNLLTQSQFDLQLQKYKQSLMNNLNLDTSKINESEKKQELNSSSALLADSVINLTDSITGQNQSKQTSSLLVPASKVQQDSFSDRLLHFQYTSKNQATNNSAVESPDGSAKNSQQNHLKPQIPSGTLTAGATPTNNQNNHHSFKNSIFYKQSHQNETKTSQFQQPQKQNPVDIYKYDFTSKNMQAAQQKILSQVSSEFSETNLQKIKDRLVSEPSYETTKQLTDQNKNNISYQEKNIDYSFLDQLMPTNIKKNKLGQDKQRSNTIAVNYPFPSKNEILQYEANQETIKFSFNAQTSSNNQKNNEVPFNFAGKITLETNQQKQNLLEEKNASKSSSNQIDENKWFINSNFSNQAVPPTDNANQQINYLNNTGNTTTTANTITHFNSSSPIHSKIASNNFQNLASTPQNISSQTSTQNNNNNNTNLFQDSSKTFSINIQNTLANLQTNQTPQLKQDLPTKESGYFKDSFKSILSTLNNKQVGAGSSTTTAAIAQKNNVRSRETRQSNNEIQNRSFRSSSNNANSTSFREFNIQDFIKSEKINDLSSKLATLPAEDISSQGNKQEEKQLNQSSNSNRANNIINSVELFKRDLNLTNKLPSTQYLDEILGRKKPIRNQDSSEVNQQQNLNSSKFSSISPLSKNQRVEFQIFTKFPEKKEGQDQKSNSISLNSNITLKQSNLISPRKLSFQAESVKTYYDKDDLKTQQQNQKNKNDINQNNIYQIKNELAFYQQSNEQFDKQNNQMPPLYDPNNINNKSKDNILNLTQQNSKNQTVKIQNTPSENNSNQEKNQGTKESFGVLPQTAKLQQSNKNSNNQSFSNMSATSDQNQQSISQISQQVNTSINDYKSLGLINSFNNSVQNMYSKEGSNNKDSSSQSSESNINAGDADNSSKQLLRKENKTVTSVNYIATALKSTTQNNNILQNTPNYFTNPFSIDKTSTISAHVFVSPKFEGADKDSTPNATPAPFSNSVSTNSKIIQQTSEASKQMQLSQVNPFDVIGLEDILKQKDLLDHNSKILQQAMTAFNLNGEQIISDDGIISDEKIAKILQSNEKRSKQNEQMVKQNEELNEKIQKTLYGLEHDQSTSQQKTLLLQERHAKKSYAETSSFSSNLPQESSINKYIQQTDANSSAKIFQSLLDAQKNILPTQQQINQNIDIINANIQIAAPPAQTLSKGSPDKVGYNLKSEKTAPTSKYHQSNSGNSSPVNANINDLLKPITPQPKERMLFTKDDVLQLKSNKKSSGKKSSSSHHLKPKMKQDQEKSAFYNNSPNKSSEKGELGISQNSQKINSIFQNNGYSSSQSSSSQLQPNQSGNLDFTSNRAEGSFTSSSSSNTAHRESYGFSSSHSPITTKRPLIFPENNTIESKFSQEQQQKSNLIVTQKVQYLKNQNAGLNNTSYSEHKFANTLNTQEFHSSDTLNNLSAGNNISKILQNTNSEGQNAVITVQVQVKQMPMPTKFMKKYKLPNPRIDHILFDNFFKKENFKIGKHLGTGKFSEVHMAQDLNTGLIVALKKIKKEVLIKYKSEDYLENEIKIQIFANHPNILKLYGFYYDEEFIYLVQEYASHGELHQELKRQPNQRFEEIKGAAYMRQVCDAFTYLHRYHIIHRDIKPENILMSFGVLKIADFGCSVYCPDDRRETFCGTIDYISPEIVNGEAYGQSVDIWSLGILTFELLTGKSPFQYETKNEILVNILNMNINIPNYLSEDAKDFIKSLLVRDPSKRMTMEQIINHKWIVQNLQKYSQEWDADLAQKCKNMVI